jgi:hypothetical protein
MATRRQFLQGAGAGALLLASTDLAKASSRWLGPTDEFRTLRASSLLPDTMLLHADLHNHTLFSDGDGDAAAAFASMRAAGLDVAALTDHSTLSKGTGDGVCGDNADCNSVAGITDTSWAATEGLADAANEDGVFTAIRGFEWSSPTLGHINVWLSQEYTDPLHDAGGGNGEGAVPWMNAEGGFPPAENAEQLDQIMRAHPGNGAGMALFYEWLSADPSRPIRGGGADAFCGFNHPGREPGRFSYFDSKSADLFGVRDRVVSLELFNRREDYLFEGTNQGAPSPLSDCLDKGWRVGILGVTDEHGTDWGHPDGKGRTGLWVTEHSRAGVREAMLARRFFATNLRGLRLAAQLNGVRMGSTVPVGSATTGLVTLDLDRGPEWFGKKLRVQILASGYPVPAVLTDVEVTLDGTVKQFPTPIGEDDRWLVLRVSDPDGAPDGRADSTYRGFGKGIAYASPFFLQR